MSRKPLWVFGYGSLMWKPGFEYLERRDAIMYGVHRRLCIYSHVHRGTPEKPGMVVGLDSGGACRGVGFRVCDTMRDETLAYLREREQATMVYKEVHRDMVISAPEGKQRVAALVYVADNTHKQYAPKQPLKNLLPYVLQGHGKGGACVDYIASTLKHLREQGLRDHHLEEVMQLVEASRSGG